MKKVTKKTKWKAYKAFKAVLIISLALSFAIHFFTDKDCTALILGILASMQGLFITYCFNNTRTTKIISENFHQELMDTDEQI